MKSVFNMKKQRIKQIAVFVEGDTDKEFFETLLSYYRKHSTQEINACKVYNLKGFGRYESKIISKVKNEVKPRTEKSGGILHAVCCSYDTDVFEFAEKPPVDWKKVKEQVKSMGIHNFTEIKARTMIEDWFLKDINGLCTYLKIASPKNIDGRDGFNKMKVLFRKGNKIYQKGNNCHKFIGNLNIEIIREQVQEELKEFERLLGVKFNKKIRNRTPI